MDIYHFIHPKLDGISGRNQYWYVNYKSANSEFFEKAHEYKDGFAIVKKKLSDDDQYRDLLGRVTNEKTASGNDYYKFITDKIELKDIEVLHFADDIFFNGIRDAIIVKAKLQARYEFSQGVLVSKSKYQESIEKDFDTIETKKIVALAMVKAKAKAERELARKIANDKSKQKIREEAFDQTLDYLESL